MYTLSERFSNISIELSLRRMDDVSSDGSSAQFMHSPSSFITGVKDGGVGNGHKDDEEAIFRLMIKHSQVNLFK